MFDLLVTTPSIIVDIVVIAIILVFGAVACAKGFMRCLIGFIGTVMSVVLALLLCKAVSSFFQEKFGWLTSISDFFCDRLSSIASLNVAIGEADELSSLSVPAFIVAIIAEAFSGTAIPSGTTAAELIAPVLAQMLLNAISFLLVFILIKIICFILNKTLGEAFKRIPGVRSVNAILGFVVGAFEAILFICAALFVITLFPTDGVRSFISSTTILNFFYNNNIAGMLFKLIVSSGWVVDFVTALI